MTELRSDILWEIARNTMITFDGKPASDEYIASLLCPKRDENAPLAHD